jgi:hypothetical protein
VPVVSTLFCCGGAQLTNLSGPSLPPEDQTPDLKRPVAATALERLEAAVKRTLRHPPLKLIEISDRKILEEAHEKLRVGLGLDAFEQVRDIESSILCMAASEDGRRGFLFLRLSDSHTGQALYPTLNPGSFRPLPTSQQCALVFPFSSHSPAEAANEGLGGAILMDPHTFEQQFDAMLLGSIDGPLAQQIQRRVHACLDFRSRKPELASVERIFPAQADPDDYSFLATTSQGDRVFGRLSDRGMPNVWGISENVHYAFGSYSPRSGFSASEGIDHSLLTGTAEHFALDGFESTELEEDSVVRDYLERVQKNFEVSPHRSFERRGWKISGELLGFDQRREAPMWLMLCSILDEEGSYVLPSESSNRAIVSSGFAGFVVSAYPSPAPLQAKAKREFLELRAFVLPEETTDLALAQLVLKPTEALFAEPIRRRVVHDLVQRHLLSRGKARKFEIEKIGASFCGSDGIDDFYAVCCKHRLGETILILRRKLSSGAILHGDDYTMWGFAPKRNTKTPKW